LFPAWHGRIEVAGIRDLQLKRHNNVRCLAAKVPKYPITHGITLAQKKPDQRDLVWCWWELLTHNHVSFASM
jgi:hypothetical protein